MSFIAVGIGVSLVGSALGAHSANKAKKAAERKEAKAAEELGRLKDTYSQLDTSNPYANMENKFEDMTIDQRQFDLQTQQSQQAQAQALQGVSEAAGGSGVAQVAQALAQQGQIASEQAGSSIGMQERENQMKERTMATNLQHKERQREVWARNRKKDIAGTLLGMSQQEVGAYREQAAAANQAKWDAIAGGVESVGNMLVQPPGASGSSFNSGRQNSSGDPYEGMDYTPCPGLVG